MYLLFNNYKIIIRQIFISFILIIIQFYLPVVKISNNLLLSIDLLLIYLTYLSLSRRLYPIIILAFFVGIFQDFIIQNDVMGLFAFVKIISVYFISYLKNVKTLWNFHFKLFYLVSIYFFHYFVYHFIFINEITSIMILFIFIESVLNVLLFIVVDKILYQSNNL